MLRSTLTAALLAAAATGLAATSLDFSAPLPSSVTAYTDDENSENGWQVDGGSLHQNAVNNDDLMGGDRYLILPDVLAEYDSYDGLQVQLDFRLTDYGGGNAVWMGPVLFVEPEEPRKSGAVYIIVQRADLEKDWTGLVVYSGDWHSDLVTFTPEVLEWNRLKAVLAEDEDGQLALRAKVWDAGTTEPEAWMLETDLPDFQGERGESVAIGTAAQWAAEVNPSVSFDNLIVTGPNETDEAPPLPSGQETMGSFAESESLDPEAAMASELAAATVVKHFNEKKYDEAWDGAEEFLTKYADSRRAPSIQKLKCDILFHLDGQRDRFWTETDKYISEASDPEQVENVRYLQAAMLEKEGRFSECRDYIQEMWKRDPQTPVGSLLVITELNTLLTEEKHNELSSRANDYLKKFGANTPEAAAANLYLGVSEAKTGSRASAMEKFDRILNAEAATIDAGPQAEHLPTLAALWKIWTLEEEGRLAEVEPVYQAAKGKAPEGKLKEALDKRYHKIEVRLQNNLIED